MQEKEYFIKIKNVIEEVEVHSKVRQLQDNSEKLQAYWEIGRLIFQFQKGLNRAKYGDEIFKKLVNKTY